MERQTIVLSLIFFAIIGMATATSSPAASPSGNSPSGVVEGPISFDAPSNGAEGPISFEKDPGSPYVPADAAPVGSPVAPETFPTIAEGPALAPSHNSAVGVSATTVVGAIVSIVAGSFLL